MIDVLEEGGLKFVGKDETGKRMEVPYTLHKFLTSIWL